MISSGSVAVEPKGVNKMQKKKISSLEYKLASILGMTEVIETSEPRTILEEEQASNAQIEKQLSTFKNATTGELLYQPPQVKTGF